MKGFTALFFLFAVIINAFGNDVRYSDIDINSSTLESIVSRFGAPISQITVGNKTRLSFGNFLVLVESRSGKIDSLIINDPEFIGPNGFRIGMSEKFLKTNDSISELSAHYLDARFGLVYWIEGGVLARFIQMRNSSISLASWLNKYSERDIGTKQALESYQTKYLNAGDHKAFAQSKSGAWAWRSKRTSEESAVTHALIACRKNNGDQETQYPCRILNINGEWQSALSEE